MKESDKSTPNYNSRNLGAFSCWVSMEYRGTISQLISRAPFWKKDKDSAYLPVKPTPGPRGERSFLMTRVFLRSHIFVTSRYQSAPDFDVNLAKYMKKYQVFSQLWSKGRLKNVWKLEPLGVHCVNAPDPRDEIDVNFVTPRWLNSLYVRVKRLLSSDTAGPSLVK